MRIAYNISAVIIFSLGVYVGVEGVRLGYWAAPGVPGPGFVPFWLGVGMAGGGIGVLAEMRRFPLLTATWFASREAASRVLVLTSLIGVATLAMNWLGTLLAIGLYLLVFLALYMPGRWPVILAVAIGAPLSVHLVFEKWLKITLLKGLFGF